MSLWKTYIRLRLLYGLESIKLSKPDLLNLEKYQRDVLCRIQHLPERAAMCSVYVLSGLLPTEAEIHRSQLTLFGNIIRQDCVERDLAKRQLAVKNSSSKSWFIMLQETLLRYNLPSAHALLENHPEKKSWKLEVKCKINKLWELEIKSQAKL